MNGVRGLCFPDFLLLVASRTGSVSPKSHRACQLLPRLQLLSSGSSICSPSVPSAPLLFSTALGFPLTLPTLLLNNAFLKSP